jgi:hypothetical protein
MTKNYDLPLSNPASERSVARRFRLPGRRTLLKLLILATVAAGALVLLSSVGGKSKISRASGGYVDVRYDQEFEKAEPKKAKPFLEDDSRIIDEQAVDNGGRDAPSEEVDEDEEAGKAVKPDFKVSHQSGKPRLTLQESLDLLHPLMREAKQMYAHLIPQEHDFTAPIFPVSIRDYLQVR